MREGGMYACRTCINRYLGVCGMAAWHQQAKQRKWRNGSSGQYGMCGMEIMSMSMVGAIQCILVV